MLAKVFRSFLYFLIITKLFKYFSNIKVYTLVQIVIL